MSGADGVAFAWPGESEPFLIILNVLSQNRFEGFEVDLPIGYRFGEQFSGLRSRFGGEVWCGARDLVGRLGHTLLHYFEKWNVAQRSEHTVWC